MRFKETNKGIGNSKEIFVVIEIISFVHSFVLNNCKLIPRTAANYVVVFLRGVYLGSRVKGEEFCRVFDVTRLWLYDVRPMLRCNDVISSPYRGDCQVCSHA